MIIKFQNCNQKTRYIEDGIEKYDVEKDRLCSKNINFYPKFYESILKDNPDIIILAEVAKAENIFNEIDKLKPNVYDYKSNSDLKYEYPNKTMIENKIMIIYNKEVFELVGEPDESKYTKEGVYNFLHLCLLRKQDMKQYNIFGIRMIGKYKEINYSIKDTNDVAFNKFIELISFVNQFQNVILLGDFNNGAIMPMNLYQNYKYYNYQNIYKYVKENSNLIVRTDGIDYENINDCNISFSDASIYSYFGEKSKIDHAVVSKTLIGEDCKIKYEMDVELSEYVAKKIKEKKCRSYTLGIPDHYIVDLRI